MELINKYIIYYNIECLQNISDNMAKFFVVLMILTWLLVIS